MAEQRVFIDNPSSTPVNMAMPANSINSPIFTTPGMNTNISAYSALVTAQPGQTATPYNFLSIFNPAASGKIFIFYQFTAFPWAGAATSTTNPMQVWRTTAASGGTLRAASDVQKFATSLPNSSAEVRTVNPTITVLGTVPLLSIPPAITSSGAGIGAAAVIVPPTGAAFHVLPGEGICARQTTAGDVDQLWDMGFTWGEAAL